MTLPQQLEVALLSALIMGVILAIYHNTVAVPYRKHLRMLNDRLNHWAQKELLKREATTINEQALPGPYTGQPVMYHLPKCMRCGQTHHNLQFRPLSNAGGSDPDNTVWATCPSTKEPLIMHVTTWTPSE